MTNKEWPEILTPEDVAEILGIDVKEARGLIKAGDLPFAKIGRQWRTKRSRIEEYQRDKGLSVDFQEFIYARQDGLLLGNLSRKYAKAREEAKGHYEAIRNKLAPEFYKELMALEDAHSSMEAGAMEVAYRQGFSDGIKIIMRALATTDAKV
ncbi:MAG: helix-turn-helix domain-containing protein [Firmicutes bacterium]|nr:helix-turn-helix domain-containing protein [Bacillota bacterium]